MNLLPREIDKLLLLHQAGFLAQKRLARGCRLNKLEATALIATVLQELVRDGNHSVGELMAMGELFISIVLLEEEEEGGKDQERRNTIVGAAGTSEERGNGSSHG